MDNDIQQQVDELVHAYREERLKNIAQANQNQATTMFNSEENYNLIKYQLDIKEELERIEHLLRGHILKIDDKGNEYWKKPEENENLLNDKGVHEILKVMTIYLSKNIILSNYDQDQINYRCKEFGKKLSDHIYYNAQEFGLDTMEKVRHYPMIVYSMVNIVEASYQRALGGRENDSLRTARMVTQTEGLNQNNQFQQIQNSIRPRTSILKPSTWFPR